MTEERKREIDAAADTLADVWFEYDRGPAFEKEDATALGIAKELIRDPSEQEAFLRTCDLDLARVAADAEETEYAASKVVALIAASASDDEEVRKAWRL